MLWSSGFFLYPFQVCWAFWLLLGFEFCLPPSICFCDLINITYLLGCLRHLGHVLLMILAQAFTKSWSPKAEIYLELTEKEGWSWNAFVAKVGLPPSHRVALCQGNITLVPRWRWTLLYDQICDHSLLSLHPRPFISLWWPQLGVTCLEWPHR